jgi:hypothetical protein
LEIFNATDKKIVVSAGNTSEEVAPGLSYAGPYPDQGTTIAVHAAGCVRTYDTPNVGQPPWSYLIGKSIKLRAAPSGLLVAYPPTPDVEIRDNPLRAMQDGALALRPMTTSCEKS